MPKKLRKIIWIIAVMAAAFLIAGLSLYATCSHAMTLDDARVLAQNKLPPSARYVDSTESENKFRILFYDEENRGKYKVEISKKTGEIKKLEAEMYDSGATSGKASPVAIEDVEKIIRGKFESIKSVYVELNKDDRRYVYKAEFMGEGFYGEAALSPETGAILSYTVKFGTAVTIPRSSDGSAGKDMLTKEQAVKAALEASGGGSLKDVEIEIERGKYYYEVDIIKGNMEIEYLIDPETGEVTVESECEKFFDSSDGSSAQKADRSAPISADAAKEIVQKRVPGAKIYDFELDKEHGRDIYEGKAVSDGYEYEFEIDAATGVILEWDKEPVEYDDDDDDDYGGYGENDGPDDDIEDGDGPDDDDLDDGLD